jgi:hypothetical protein
MPNACTRIVTAAALAACCIPCLGACGGGVPADHRPQLRRLLSVDRRARVARLALLIGYDGAASSLNIDGSFKGALLFAVPRGWRIVVECANESRFTRYACAIVPAPGAAAQPAQGLGIAHPRAGLPPGARVSFTAPPLRVGLYRMLALQASGGSFLQPAGMWVVLKVSERGAPYARWLR